MKNKNKDEVMCATPIVMAEPQKLDGIDLLEAMKAQILNMPVKSHLKIEYGQENCEVSLKCRRCANGNVHLKAILVADNGEERKTQIVTEDKKDNIVRRNIEDVTLGKDMNPKKAVEELKDLTNKDKGSVIGKSESTVSRLKNR